MYHQLSIQVFFFLMTRLISQFCVHNAIFVCILNERVLFEDLNGPICPQWIEQLDITHRETCLSSYVVSIE